MKSRLFWKILFGFWLTFIAITQGVWMVITLYENPHAPPRGAELLKLKQIQLQSAGLILRAAGPGALQTLKNGWHDRNLFNFAAIDEVVKDSNLTPVVLVQEKQVTATPPAFSRKKVFANKLLQIKVHAMDGKNYQLTYDLGAFEAKYTSFGPLDVPLELIFMGVLGGLIFSATLAWYLVQPIHRLRLGFSRLAQGELGARLCKEMGRRRDEIANLALDFDQMAERLQHLVASRDRLLHDVSHELRSPLARMQIAVALARQNPQKLDAMLDRIEAETSRQDEMVDELLTLERVESGAQIMNTPFDLCPLLQTIIEDTQFEAESAQVQITPDLASASAPLRGRPELLRRAIENIVRNAIRFSVAGQLVCIRQWCADQQAFIEVKDAGPGVTPELLTTMFDPFVRAQSDGEGFGLGLTIAKRAVEAHGGQIWACNGEQKGLVMTIRLPLMA